MVSLLTSEQGLWRGLVKGGAGRARAATWQQGNLVTAHWTARLADQLGNLAGELVHHAAAPVMDDPLAIEILASACAVTEAALAEREPEATLFGGLARLMVELPAGAPVLAGLVRFELTLLTRLGFGLDLSACVLSGSNSGLAYVSPRSGRAVTAAAAGDWADRLLVLPPFVLDESEGDPPGWRDGLRLSGHFLARDLFGQTNRGLPPARERLLRRVEAMVAPEG